MDQDITAIARHYRVDCAPRKARLLRNLIIGKSVSQALAILTSERRAGSVAAAKLICSAAAQFSPDSVKNAVIFDFTVSEGSRRNKFMPRAQGRATPVVKRTSHFIVKLKLK